MVAMLEKLGRKFRTQVWDYTLATSAVIVAAVGGVVATKVFELTKADSTIVILYASLVICLLMILSGVIVFGIRPHSLSKWGTGYYIGVLGVKMRDDHGSSFKKLIKGAGYQDYRALTHKLSLPGSHGFDWVDDINSIYQRMQDSMNEDDVSTGYLIVPNLLFPAAIAFGSQIYFPNDIEFVEMPDDPKDRKEISADKWPRWSPFDMEKRIKDFDLGSDPKIFEILECRVGESRDLSPEKPIFISAVECRSKTGVILVTVQNRLTGGGKLNLDNVFDVGHHFSLIPHESFDDAKIISDDVSGKQLHQIYEVENPGGKTRTKNIHAEDLLNDVLLLVARALQFRERMGDANIPIVLCARLPKTVSFELGQAFDLLNPGRDSSSLWENLVILNWERGGGVPGGRWRIARVHPSQKSLDEQYRQLERYGYVAPPIDD